MAGQDVKDMQGRVMIQATQVNHPILKLQQHDYKKMYDFEC